MNTSDDLNSEALDLESTEFTGPSDQDSPAVDAESDASAESPPWLPLSRMQRRVAGVLIEKSKTTPDVYPMTINGIKTASNQKSNRSPQMDLREDQVEETLYELRKLGSVIEVQSGGRVPKFKHELYEWLGVEKVELAVMAELLLRGEQSLGDLRGRASRMDRIEGVSELKPIVRGLIKQGLMIELTPPGRGQIVTHNLYQPDELQRLRAEHGNYEPAAISQSEEEPENPREATEASHSRHSVERIPAVESSNVTANDPRVEALIEEVAQLKAEVEVIREQLDSLLH